LIVCKKGTKYESENNESINIIPTLASRDPVLIGMPHISRIKSILSKFRPDVVHLQVPSVISLIVAKYAQKMGIPAVAGIHDLPDNISAYSPFLRSSAGKVAQFFLVRWFRSISTAVSPSEYGKSYYRSHGVDSDIRVISNGVDSSLFRQNRAAAQDFVNSYLGKSNRQGSVVLYVGRISPEKNLEVLIRAVSGSNATIVVVGGAYSKHYFRKLRKLALSGDTNVIFTGAIPLRHLIGAYSACDVLVQPSTCELQSLVALEAMSCGKPVIAADQGPMPEIITNEENGALFRPLDHVDLRAKIENVLSSSKIRKKQMSAACLDLAATHSLDLTVKKYTDLYFELAASRAK